MVVAYCPFARGGTGTGDGGERIVCVVRSTSETSIYLHSNGEQDTRLQRKAFL